MHRKVVVFVSSILFALLSVIAVIVVDSTDRGFPADLGVKSSGVLSFERSGLDDRAAFAALGQQSEHFGLGLVKEVPDLGGGANDRVYISFADGPAPRQLKLFRQEDKAEIKDKAALENSYASGQYLITGETPRFEEFKTWLEQNNITAQWVGNSFITSIKMIAFQAEFAIAVVAAITLLIGLGLYWLTALARGRALRVLGGVSIARVQSEDFVGVVLPTIGSAFICGAAATAIVGLRTGWIFAPIFLRTAAILFGVVLAIFAVLTMLMLWISIPAPHALANRVPGVVALRKVSTGLKVVTFVMVAATIGPAFTAYQQAADSASDLAQWRSLANQTTISHRTSGSGGGEDVFQRIKHDLGRITSDAQKSNAVGLSYTWVVGNDYGGTFSDLPFDVSLVNPKWLTLMDRDPATHPELIQIQDLGTIDDVLRKLRPSLQLWRRDRNANTDALADAKFYRFNSDRALPLAKRGSGDLKFSQDALLILVPDICQTFNDDFLGSIMSIKNLVFEGLADTNRLVQKYGLSQNLRVFKAAEEGVLRAQYSAYFAWLRGVSLVGMVTALLVSVAVGAIISAILAVKRDFPLRLHGYSYWRIITSRLYLEYAFIFGTTSVVMLLQHYTHWWAPTGVAVLAIIVTPCAHILATRWCIRKTIQRTL